MTRRVCVVIGSRANYASIRSVLEAVKRHDGLELKIVAAASAILYRYGSVADLIEEDGFEIDERVHMLVEGETPVTMAKSTGLGLIELTSVFDRLKPDWVVTVGDRFETIATAIAAAYMNIRVAHTMGGEVTGTIDESIRHAVTKFAHLHFPASAGARDRILRLGERPEDVLMVGCPRIDLVAKVLEEGTDLPADLFDFGVGDPMDISKPFLLVSQHPVTTEYGHTEEQIGETLAAVRASGLQAIVLWPNADAGSEDLARGIRKAREHGLAAGMHFFKNLPTDVYLRLMARTACLIGNSSSGIREGAFIGTPVVNIGSRQDGRDRGKNVIDVPYDAERIRTAIAEQVAHGRYASEPVYGDGLAGDRIANALAEAWPPLQKQIVY